MRRRAGVRLSAVAAHVAAGEDEQDERVCVVTGGSSGIGAAVCRLFAGRGHRVISVARRRSSIAGVESVDLDLAEPAGAQRAAEAVLAMLRGRRARVCLVHGASNYPNDSVEHVDTAGLERALRLNVAVPAELSSLLLPVMSRGSSVVFIGSTLSDKAVAGRLSYCAAKHAMMGLMRAVAQDILWSGVHTALVCPGITDTAMVREAVAGREEAFESFVRGLQGRVLSPEEVASFIWDVARSPVLHGAVLHCNNGQKET